MRSLMPPNAFLLEASSRGFICRSCLASLRKTVSQPRWGTRSASSSHAAAAPATGSSRSKAPTTDNTDRQRILNRLGLTKQKEAKPYDVKYFEEGEGGRIQPLDGEEDFRDALNGRTGDLAKHLKELEDEMGEVKDVFNKLVQGDSSGGRTKLTVSDADLRIETDLLQNIISRPKSASIFISGEPWKPTVGKKGQRQLVMYLNKTLQRVAKQVESGSLKSKDIPLVWKAYSSARPLLALQWEVLPQGAWDLIWDVLSADIPQNANRMSHVYVLAKDMDLAGVELSDSQKILSIEAMFVEGWKDEAIKNHRRLVTTLGEKRETFMDFWQLGLRMYCLMGDLERAERILDRIFDSHYYDNNARILIPFIRACTEKPEAIEKAYDHYQELRDKLGSRMTIDDYDQIIAYFLAANQTEHALYIFVEMMTSGSINLRGRSKLPAAVANPFFVGKWLKRLIGAGDLHGAYNVLLHMKDKGIQPSPIQINGLIGAWLRSGTAEDLEKAETTAWAMINSRLQFVQQRDRTSRKLDKNITLKQSGTGWAKATLETFSLLAENYKDRGMSSKMEELWHAFRRAAIAPDSFMLNQLLLSLLKDGRARDVPQLCRTLTSEYSIDPDPSTFQVLWSALPANSQHYLSQAQIPEEIARSRQLFAEMVAYSSNFSSSGGIDLQLARKVMHTFRFLGDKVGTLVAFRALRQIFNLRDPGPLVVEFIVGTSDLEKALRNRKMKYKMGVVGQRIEHYLEFRKKELVEAGQLKTGEELTLEMKTEELGNFLDLFLESEIKEVKNVEGLFREAAQEMGVYTGDGEAAGKGQ